tara:strand:- start:4388 stop:4777 length:390 start_codon:yes stop_codon:yes gene_type:complete
MTANATDTGHFTFLEYKAPAPYEGVLFNDTALAKILSDYDMVKYSCDIRTDYEIKVLTEEYEYKLENLKIEHEALTDEYDLFIIQKDKEIDLLAGALRKTSPRYKWLYFTGGVILGGLGYYALDKELSK